MRGKRALNQAVSGIGRITPAGAGKTRLGCWAYQWATDHPRRCGENYFVKPAALRAIGSPPQVRGKLSYSRYVEQLVRITPAGAGKTAPGKRQPFEGRDHPRRCGENEMQVITARVSEGSPPQVRGKHSYLPIFGHFNGITPAGAGKTRFFSNFTSPLKDHPRRCGENFAPVAACMILIGSPPQVRGKHSSKNVGMLLMRITPAGAGKTFRIPLAVRPSKDHPRRCGENLSAIFRAAPDLGSPPQVRGKPYLCFFRHN